MASENITLANKKELMMKVKNINTLAKFIFCILFISACSRDTLKPNTTGSDYFPNKVGDYWEYQVYDSSSMRDHPEIPRNYTVKVTITGVTNLLDNMEASIWRCEYPYGTELQYVRIASDTVKVYDSIRVKSITGLNFPLLTFIVPFKDKQSWKGSLLYVDNYNVTAKDSVKNAYIKFLSGYNIYHYYEGPNMEDKDLITFVPNVGFTNIYYHHFNFAPYNIYSWQLTKYNLH